MKPASALRRLVLVALAALLAACAALTGSAPPKVSFAGMEGLAGEGMELRFTIKLRVQNPGQTTLDIDGVALDLAVRGMGLASGVSPVKASVPRFGETVLSVPVTVPATAMLRQAWGLAHAREVRKIEFELSGRLGGGPFGAVPFTTKGEFDWPPGSGSGSGSAAARP